MQESAVWAAFRVFDKNGALGEAQMIPLCFSFFFVWGVSDVFFLKLWRNELLKKPENNKNEILDGGFRYFLFSPLLGEDFHFD